MVVITPKLSVIDTKRPVLCPRCGKPTTEFARIKDKPPTCLKCHVKESLASLSNKPKRD